MIKGIDGINAQSAFKIKKVSNELSRIENENGLRMAVVYMIKIDDQEIIGYKLPDNTHLIEALGMTEYLNEKVREVFYEA